MFWRMRFAKIFGNGITGYFCGLGSLSFSDSGFETKLINALIGSFILMGIQVGRLLQQYGDKRK